MSTTNRRALKAVSRLVTTTLAATVTLGAIMAGGIGIMIWSLNAKLGGLYNQRVQLERAGPCLGVRRGDNQAIEQLIVAGRTFCIRNPGETEAVIASLRGAMEVDRAECAQLVPFHELLKPLYGPDVLSVFCGTPPSKIQFVLPQ